MACAMSGKAGSIPAVLLLGIGATLTGLSPASHALQIIQQEELVFKGL